MNFKRFLSLGFVSASFLCLALPVKAQIAADMAVERNQEAVESPISEKQAPSIEMAEWSDSNDIKEGFIQGCMGNETLDADLAETKENYCQCAFDEYANRYTPYQFLQINTLANRIGEEGLLLVNLMMGREMNSCAEKTGFELQ